MGKIQLIEQSKYEFLSFEHFQIFNFQAENVQIEGI